MSLQSNELIGVLENEEAKDFITKHLDDKVEKLALSYSSKVNFDLPLCLSILKIYQKAKHKIPSFVHHRLALTDRSYQQCSSERIAKHKASILQGDSIIDLTGGLAVDSLAFAKKFERVVSVDSDPVLDELVKYNLGKLKQSKIERILGRAEDQDVADFDWVYLDPDRREGPSRKFLVSDLEPNIEMLLPLYMEMGLKVAVKLSPLLEANSLIDVWPKEIKELHFISEDNEMKEILALFYQGKQAPKLIAENLGKHPFRFEMSADTHVHIEQNWNEGSFLYFPLPALSKSRLADYYAQTLGFNRLPAFEIYQSSQKIAAVGFKAFQVLERHKRDLKRFKNLLKDKGIKGLNIWTKGSTNSPQILAQKLGIKEGGEYYLIELGAEINSLLLCKLLH